MFHIVLPVFGIMPFSLCIFLCFSHVCLLRRPVEAKPVQTQSISERDLGRARCLLWFGGQLWRQPQSTRVENIFLGFLFLSRVLTLANGKKKSFSNALGYTLVLLEML